MTTRRDPRGFFLDRRFSLPRVAVACQQHTAEVLLLATLFAIAGAITRRPASRPRSPCATVIYLQNEALTQSRVVWHALLRVRCLSTSRPSPCRSASAAGPSSGPSASKILMLYFIASSFAFHAAALASKFLPGSALFQAV